MRGIVSNTKRFQSNGLSILTCCRIIIIPFLLQANAKTLLAQAVHDKIISPKELIDEFVKIETTGGRLSAHGRRETCNFFVRASPYGAHPRILVIGPDYLVWEAFPVSNGKTQIAVEIEPKGFIDASLKFVPLSHHFMKNSAFYNLVFAAADLRSNSECKSSKDMGDSKHWMIDGPNDVIMITSDIAIHYLEVERDRPADPALKKNASDAISQLSKLK
jgi:hypothetical protein